LDFANTVDDPLGPARHDHLATYEDLVRWSVRAGVLRDGRGAAQSGAALRRAHALRDTLNEVFGAVATGDEVHWEELRPYVVDAVAHASLSETYSLTWPDATEPHAMLWPVAHAAAQLLTGPDVHRVKRCAGCPWLFLDRSRNGSRRWCAMNDCGTHEKIRKYVARRAARRVSS
ncbi:CGNR zinc finger domain-containing protein, partial [Actinophytocola sp.]|uniref:CGNR zinc finger domain-containing protein n=1 Tax=Actinophytocola sp. TaxID=1872138 RepID=UPI00389A1C7F